jgi:hypothetical protein
MTNMNISDTSPSSLKDSIMSPKVKTMKRKGIRHVPWLAAFQG